MIYSHLKQDILSYHTCSIYLTLIPLNSFHSTKAWTLTGWPRYSQVSFDESRDVNVFLITKKAALKILEKDPGPFSHAWCLITSPWWRYPRAITCQNTKMISQMVIRQTRNLGSNQISQRRFADFATDTHVKDNFDEKHQAKLIENGGTLGMALAV